MNRQEVLALGVPEDKYKEFQAVYHRDLRKAAERIVKKNEDCRIVPTVDEYREAILAIIKLLPDPERLKRVLGVANNQYFNMCRDKEATQRTEESEGDSDGGSDVQPDRGRTEETETED